MVHEEKILVSLYSQYRAHYSRGLALKTVKAQRKAFDRADALRFEFDEVAAIYFPRGVKFQLGSDFGVTQKYPLIAGILHKRAVVTILDVIGGALNVSVLTAEHPTGEVFSINLLDGYMGHLNIQNVNNITRFE